MDVSRYIVALMASVMFVVLTVAAARKCQLVYGATMYIVKRKLSSRISGWATIRRTGKDIPWRTPNFHESDQK